MNHTTRPTRRSVLTAGLGVAAATALPGLQAHAQQAKRVLRVGNQKGLLSLLKGRGTAIDLSAFAHAQRF